MEIEDFSCCADLLAAEAAAKETRKSRINNACANFWNRISRALSKLRKKIKNIVDHKYFQQGMFNKKNSTKYNIISNPLIFFYRIVKLIWVSFFFLLNNSIDFKMYRIFLKIKYKQHFPTIKYWIATVRVSQCIICRYIVGDPHQYVVNGH